MELIDDNIYRYKNNIFPSNTYFYMTGVKNNCLIIDPGLDADTLVDEVEKASLLPICIIATHGHFDHIGSAHDFQNVYNIPFYIHKNDLKLIKAANFFLKIAKISHQINTPVPDNLIEISKYEFHIDGVKIVIQHTPGHSNGSCVIKINNFLFSGDTLYRRGLGFNNLPGENKDNLKDSLRYVLNNFDKNLMVLPGHGEPDYLKNIITNNLDLINFLQL